MRVASLYAVIWSYLDIDFSTIYTYNSHCRLYHIQRGSCFDNVSASLGRLASVRDGTCSTTCCDHGYLFEASSFHTIPSLAFREQSCLQGPIDNDSSEGWVQLACFHCSIQVHDHGSFPFRLLRSHFSHLFQDKVSSELHSLPSMGREMVCSGERPADFVGDERLDFVVLLVHVTDFIDATARCSEDFDR